MIHINLPVPFFSQRDNNYIWHYKRTLSSILLHLVILSCFAVTFEDVEAYELMPVEFNRKVKILSEKVSINDFKTEVEIEISCEDLAGLEASIVCKPCGYGRSYTDMLIPKDFEIFEDNEKIDFFVLYEGKERAPEEAFSIAGYHPSEIHFCLAPASNAFTLRLSYYNRSIIKLDEWGYGFTLMNYRFASKKSQKNVVIKYTDNTEELVLTEVLNINDYDNKILFWNSDAEKKCDVLRNINANGEIYWECGLPKDTAQLEVVFEDGYMELTYNNRFCLGGLNISKYLIDCRLLFFLPKEYLEILRNSFYAIHGYNFRNQKWKDYFSKMYEKKDSKYIINPNFSESDFNETERKNIALIREMESIKEPLILSDYLK